MIVPIISIPVAVVGSAVHTSKVNKQIVQDFVAKGFPEGTITPNAERSGFVFFDLETGRTDLSGLSLEMTGRNRATGDTLTLSTPLPATTFTPKKPPTEERQERHQF